MKMMVEIIATTILQRLHPALAVAMAAVAMAAVGAIVQGLDL